MKALVLYYSRTGTTRKVAEEIASALSADLEELKDHRKRSGPIGFIKSGFEARAHKTVALEPLSHDLSTYDLIVVGTPVWASTMCSPVRTLLLNSALRGHKVAWFCTASSTSRSMHDSCLDAMTSESGLRPVATLGLSTKSLKHDHSEAISTFVASIRSAAS